MADPFVGQLMLVGFNFAPIGWFQAQGQLLPISQQTALFSLLGTFYGGNGTSNFALPNMQGNVPVGMGQGPGLTLYDIGETGGSSTVTLLPTTTPSHTHAANGSTGIGDLIAPGGNALARSTVTGTYNNTSGVATTQLGTAGNSPVSPPFGGSQPHNNLMQYLALNWIICFQGVFPTRS
jgi:microcystin-dependent protein